MKQCEFVKSGGEVADMQAIHAWLDKSVKWLTNGRHVIEIKRSVRKRSLAQNRLMWLWFACIEQETGQYAADIHDYYCLKYLPHDITDLATGETVRVAGHTSILTTEAFTDFLNKVQADAATELGITLPSPEDEAWQEFENEYRHYVQC